MFPRRAGSHYQGDPIALWVLVPITLVTVIRSLIQLCIDGGAQSIATIPLDTFSRGAADTVVLIFALGGLSQLLLGSIFVLVF